MVENNHLWGVDLGGTKIELAVIVNRQLPEVVIRQRIATEAHKGYQHIIAQIKSLVDDVVARLGYYPKAIGFGTPGTIEPSTGLMKNCNTTCLNHKPLLSDLTIALGCQVKLANDANCFALAENLFGAAKGANSVFGVIIGTGVGGGLVVNQQVINGLQGIAGEWGMNVVDPQGEVNYSGIRGTVESIIAGPALEKYYFSISGKEEKLIRIVENARDGEPEALKTLERLYEYFGRGLAQVINVFDPEVVVIGGGVGNIDELYTNGVNSLAKYVFNTQLNTPILKPKLGDSAGVFGAALLV